MEANIVIDPDNDVNHWFDGRVLKPLPAGSGRGNLMVALGYTRKSVDATTWAELQAMFPTVPANE